MIASVGSQQKPYRWALHPILFACSPLPNLYARNAGEIYAGDLFAIGVGLATAAFLSTLLVRLAVKRTAAAALIVSLWMIPFFIYMPLFSTAVNKWPESLVFHHRYLLPLTVVACAAGSVAIYRGKEWVERLSRVANVAAIVMLAASVLDVAYAQTQMQRVASAQHDPASHASGGATVDAAALPDIYWVILDAYSRQDVLKEEYGFDNSEFIGYLREIGFFVADRTTANYAFTSASLAATMNLDYIDDLSREMGPDALSQAPLFAHIRSNEVVRRLRAYGYSFVVLNSGFGTTDFRTADIRLQDMSDPWSTYGALATLIEQTPASLFWSGWGRGSFKYSAHRRRIDWQLDQMVRLPKDSRPRFVLAHIVSPHWPYVHSRDGAPVAAESQDDGAAYVNQIVYLNGRMRSILDGWFAETGGRKKIIILQSDHGKAPRILPLGVFGYPGDRWVAMQMASLNALYFPGGAPLELHPAITPVNTFRLVLKYCCGESLPMLPDRILYSWMDRPYKQTDVTAIVARPLDELTGVP